MGAEQSTSGGTWNVFSNRGTMMEMKKIPSPITVQEPKSEPQCNGAASVSGMESTENIEEAMTENEGMTKTTTTIEQSVQSNTTTKKNNNEGDTNTAVGELAYRPVESLDLQCVDWEGYVQKKGHLLRNWRTRYFTLEGNILSYYENKEDARQRKHLKGRCTVVDVKIDNRARTAHGNDFIFETKEGKHFHISAYSAIDRILWCHMIEAAIDFDAMKSAKPTVFSTHDFRHLKTFTTEMLYDRYRRILTDEMDLISEFIFSFNGDLVISSYYPRLMPFHGDFFGREGLVYIISTMRETFEILDYNVLSISREGTQVTVTGKEKLRCRTTGAEIEEPWTHHITLDPYGKITNLKIDINIREAKGNWSTFSSSNSFPELYSAGVRTIRTLSISLHDFTVFHVIGKGGFGTVVNAMKKSDGKIYALKILEKAQMTKYDIESSFTEMRVAQNIHHPFVAGLRIAFQSPTKLFLGMNYYSGGDLFHHMSQGATCRIAPDRAKFYTAELTLAIHHLHQHDILYRDIKPENVMIDADGHIALVDFGLAKLHVSNYQGAKTMAGSPQYTAPELLLPKDQRSYGKAADWWSLGILLYEMSVGKSPFYDQNVEKMYQKIFNDDLTFPPRPVLPDSLKDLLSGLLRKNPTERYGNKISDLLEHAYFSDINWDLLLQKKVDAPWKPQVKSALDVVYVDSEFTELNASDEVSSPNKRDSSKSFIAKNFIEKIGINKNWKSSTDIAAQDPTFKDFMYYCENPDDFVEVETLKDELRETGALSKQEGSVTPVSCCSSASPRERDSECMTPKGTPPINCLTNESRELADSRTKLRVGTPLAAFIQSGDLHSSFSLNSKESAELNDDTTVQIGLFAPLQSPPQDVVSPSSNGPIDGQGVTFEVLRRDKDSSGTSSDGNSTAEGDGTIELYADANVNNADTLIIEHLTVKDSNRDGENKEVQNSSRNIDNNEKVENAESLNK